MARPKTQDSVILEIKSARADGLTLDKIQDRMQETRDKGVVDTPMPGRGTVAKYTKEYDALPDSLKDLDKPFEYHLMETYGLPWEAGSYLLDMWVWVRESGPFPAMRFAVPPPSVRQAQWWWRVHLACPEIGRGLVWGIAQSFVARELIHERLGEPLLVADIEAYLAYKPWLSEQREVYAQALQAGRVPHLHPIKRDWIVSLALVGETTDESIRLMVSAIRAMNYEEQDDG